MTSDVTKTQLIPGMVLGGNRVIGLLGRGAWARSIWPST
jgi:hypothetical protein